MSIGFLVCHAGAAGMGGGQPAGCPVEHAGASPRFHPCLVSRQAGLPAWLAASMVYAAAAHILTAGAVVGLLPPHLHQP